MNRTILAWDGRADFQVAYRWLADTTSPMEILLSRARAQTFLARVALVGLTEHAKRGP